MAVYVYLKLDYELDSELVSELNSELDSLAHYIGYLLVIKASQQQKKKIVITLLRSVFKINKHVLSDAAGTDDIF